MNSQTDLNQKLIENPNKSPQKGVKSEQILSKKYRAINNQSSIENRLVGSSCDADMEKILDNQKDNNELQQAEQPQKKKERFTSFNVDDDMTWKNGPKKVLDLIVFSMQNIIYNSGLFITYICNMYFVRLQDSSDLMAGFGLASTFFAAFGFASIYAMNYGMQALGSQAYGAGKFELVGVIFQRGLYINLLYLISVSPLFFFLRDVLQFIGINMNVEIQTYSRLSLLFIFLICIERSFRTYLNCQREYFIPTYCAVGAYILHPLWLYLLCIRADLGINGIAWSMAITEGLTLLSSFIICTLLKKYQKTWDGFSRQAFLGWWEYLKISISVGASSYIEWFSFELQTVIVGFLNDEDQMAAHSSQVSLMLFYYMIPIALNQTIGTYLGNSVGAGQVRLSKNLIKLTYISIIILSIIMIGIGAGVQPLFVKLYCTNDDMEHYFKLINNIYIYFFMFGDNLQGISQCVLRTIGQEKWANVIFFSCFFLTGSGLSAILVHVAHLGAPGAWWAYAISAYIAVFFLVLLLKKTNIKKCLEKISDNIKTQEQKEIEDEDIKLIIQEQEDSS
ncbi:hypothetical protein ABPG72_015060 [Tetrahymena utriculariae]